MMAHRIGKDPLDYINEAKAQKRQTMKRRFQEYNPNAKFVDRFERVDQKFYLIIFSADWCSDCHIYVSSLAKTLLLAKNNMIAAKVVDYDSYRDIADELRVRGIPTMIIFDNKWREVGRFVEAPRKSGTVEEDICMIMEAKMAATQKAAPPTPEVVEDVKPASPSEDSPTPGTNPL